MHNKSSKPSFYIMDQDLLQDEVLTEAEIEDTQSASASAAVLLKNILQGLDASLKALARPDSDGGSLSAASLAEMCKESGLHPDLVNNVVQEYRTLNHQKMAPKNIIDPYVKICPAFDAKLDGNGVCIGNACGLSCRSIPL